MWYIYIFTILEIKTEKKPLKYLLIHSEVKKTNYVLMQRILKKNDYIFPNKKHLVRRVLLFCRFTHLFNLRPAGRQLGPHVCSALSRCTVMRNAVSGKFHFTSMREWVKKANNLLVIIMKIVLTLRTSWKCFWDYTLRTAVLEHSRDSVKSFTSIY